MNYFLSLIARHGYALVSAVVLAESIGLPMPAALALVTGGAAAAAGILSAPMLLLLGTVAMLLGDSLLYVLGRYMGWGLLGFLCRVSVNPETCILRSAESFYKRGKITLVIAKFIPGGNTMAPPLAGSMKMRFLQFLRLDLAGATLYVAAYLALGFLFRKYDVYHVAPRVQVQELAQKLASDQNGRILIVDVRSHGYYDAGTERIKGSIRLEPNNLSDELKTLPKN